MKYFDSLVQLLNTVFCLIIVHSNAELCVVNMPSFKTSEHMHYFLFVWYKEF